MIKPALACLLIALFTISLPGCDVITGESVGKPADNEIPVETDFGHMLGYVPRFWLEDHDVWFGNPGKLKSLYGLEDIASIGEAIASTDDTRMKAAQALSDTGLYSLNIARSPEVFPLIGFDIMAVDRALYGNIIPPRGYYILEGSFDEALIGQKLTEQGYTETDYGRYSYYGIRGDFQMDLRNPLGRLVMASMNRVAVFDDTIITSPVAADITGIFDAMAGDTPSAIENNACRALADSLGDVLMATLTTPERIIFSDLAAEEERPIMFDFTLPDSWGILQGYEMAALGHRTEGDKHYFDIALYYSDAAAAKADGEAIIKRMENYTIGRWLKGAPICYLTEQYRIGEPAIRQYPEGVVLKISCQRISEELKGNFLTMGGAAMPFRDLLFLAPDPSEYVGKSESTAVIYKRNP